MTQPIIAIVGGLVLIGFIVFAFRQGMKVTPVRVVAPTDSTFSIAVFDNLV